ncbi:MAG: hypothetical protein FJ308_17765 [Planctomycetes bacterium]|nr:hypothetical protein [Planctomycetota bacterium]
MPIPSNDMPEQSRQFDRLANLAAVNPRTWFLGCGVGCATGLAATYAILSIWNGHAAWIAIAALLLSMIHATVITLFWQYRDVVHRRTAVMASMIASSILLCVLAILIGSRGLPTSPLFAFAFIHLILAFSHPLLFVTNTKPA